MVNYKVGDKVWVKTLNEEKEKLTIKTKGANILGINMYSFEETGNVCVGEIYLRKSKTAKHTKTSDYFTGRTDVLATSLNTTAMGLNCSPDSDDERDKILKISYFQPDYTMVEWIANYIGERVMIEVGCSNGHFLRFIKHMLKREPMGIEPNYNLAESMRLAIAFGKDSVRVNVHPAFVEECRWLKGLGEKGVIVVSNPLSRKFIYETISMLDDTTEVIYIFSSKEEKEYLDALYEYREFATKLPSKGTGKEKEIVYSIKRK